MPIIPGISCVERQWKWSRLAHHFQRIYTLYNHVSIDLYLILIVIYRSRLRSVKVIVKVAQPCEYLSPCLIYKSLRSILSSAPNLKFPDRSWSTDLQDHLLPRFPFVVFNIKVLDRAWSTDQHDRCPVCPSISPRGTHLGIDQRHLAGIQNEDDNEQAPQQRQLWTLRRSRLGSRRSHSSVVEVLSVCVYVLAVIWLNIYLGGRQF